MNLKNKKIGIWGYGIVGRSALAFLPNITAKISLYDQKELTSDAQDFLKNAHVTYYKPDQLERFLQEQDFILPSPGIDLRPYAAYQPKFIGELDLFKKYWHKPVIGITGTIGKTTITHLLSQILPAAGVPVATGGNIGTGMLDLLPLQSTSDYALLELSSFQLELNQYAAPDIAVITNIYPNHIDRHGSFEAYIRAKLKILLAAQVAKQALVPLSLAHYVRKQDALRSTCYFSDTTPTTDQLLTMNPPDAIYYQRGQQLYKWINGNETPCDAITLPALSYPGNLLIIQALFDMLEINPDKLKNKISNLHIPEHRLACIAEHNNIRFYNDSKATIPEAMLAAVTKLKEKPVILFLGGVSKGVDRKSSIEKLKHLGVKHVLCFGKEAQDLSAACAANSIDATSYTTLEEAFACCMQSIAQAGDQVLFSPAGASFDLFSNYQARGDIFTKLVKDYCR